MKINGQNVSKLVFATTPNPFERSHIFECLWDSDRIYEASFIITYEGHIKPNIQWFKEHGNHRAQVYYSLIGFFDGWDSAKTILFPFKVPTKESG